MLRSIAGSNAAASVAGRLRALGAIAHFDPSWGATDNGTTSTWIDRIGGNVVQASGSTRLAYTSSVSAFNGRPGWTATSALSTRLVSVGSALAAAIDGSQPITIYSVSKHSTGLATCALFGCGSTTTTDYLYQGMDNASGPTTYVRRSSGATVIATGLIKQLSDAHVQSMVYSGTQNSGWGNSGPDLAPTSNDRTPTCDRFVIGALLSSGAYSSFFDGAIGDIVIFATAHSASVRRTIEQLLANKYDWPVLFGITGFTTSNYLTVAAGLGVLGATGVGVWNDVLLRANAVPSGGQYLVNAAESAPALAGFSNYHSGANARTLARNSITTVNSPDYTWVAADVGKLRLYGATADLTNVRAFMNGAQVGAGSAMVGYTQASPAMVTGIGAQRDGTSPATSFTLFGMAGGNLPQNATDQANRCAAIKAAKAFVATGGATPSRGWAFRNAAPNYANIVGSTIAPAVMSGTLSDDQIIVPTWPW